MVLSTYWAKENKMKSESKNFFFTSIEKESIKNKCLEVLEHVGLREKASVATSSLSYGDKRMLEIGMSLSLEPKILLLDEPLAGLSDHEITEIITLIQKLENKFTIVIIEHKISKIIDIVHSLHVMNTGELICEGIPREVITNAKVRECYWGKEEGTNCLM
jgi:branched-chain amino acid transport system ATP-binding protein